MVYIIGIGNMDNIKIAAAYLRVSTDKQDEYSLDSQLKLIREYAAKNNYTVPEDFVFVDDGISGRSAKKRPAFQEMVANAKDKSHPFEAVLLWKFSRFARNQEESIFYKSMLSRCGVDVISISEPLVDGPFGSLIERILEWMDEFYSIRLSGEVKRGMTEKVSRGEIVTIPSYGYDVDGRKYVPNADADTVRSIYASYLNGTGMAAIARELGAQGVVTRRGNLPDNRWVKYILQNPVYIGKLRWSKDGKQNYTRRQSQNEDTCILIDAGHEHIIDKETWDAVQLKLLSENKGRRKYQRNHETVDWMLKGLVRCSACGATLVYTSTACPTMQCYRYAHGECQTSHSLSVAKANRIVIAALEDCIACNNFPLAAPPAEPVKAGKDHAKRIAAEKVKLRRVQEAYEAGIDTLEEYAEKKRKTLAAIAEAERRAASVSVAPVHTDMKAYSKKVAGVLEIIKDSSATEKQKNAALRSVISYIVYEKADKRLALFFYT